jgi:hypothetical protein
MRLADMRRSGSEGLLRRCAREVTAHLASGAWSLVVKSQA